MPVRSSSSGAATAPGRLASLFATVALLLACTLAPAPARAASTLIFGPLAPGGSQAIDVELPLTLSIASIPASYDGFVLFNTADPGLVAGFGAFGFSMPITVGQLRTQFPAATIAFPAPSVVFDNPGGGFALASLGCTALACSYRATFSPPAPGAYAAQVQVSVASVTTTGTGVLGVLVDLLYPFLATFVGGFLVVDLQGTGVAAPAASATVAVPGVTGAAALGLSALLALVAAIALRSRQTADAASLRGRCKIGPP